MTKKELAEKIAANLFPSHYRLESPAVQGEITNFLKKGKPELEAIAKHGGLI